MSSPTTAGDGPPILQAISSSARQMFQLLNCIRFAPKAHVQISSDGLRFAVEDSRVMQGTIFLDKALFTSFTCNLPASSHSDAQDEDPDTFAPDLPNFQISLSALLETLQIFGAADANARFSKPGDDYTSNIRRDRPNAFTSQSLGLTGICRISYAFPGAPLSIVLEEGGVITTCNLTTYEPELAEEIPFMRNAMLTKIILPSPLFLNALSELASLTPQTLSIHASTAKPYFSLSATGHLGSASVDWARGRDLLETFFVADCPSQKWEGRYGFDMIKHAAEAMRVGSKVSIRGDEQGVLSLQVMVELEGGGMSFVDFRFVPFLKEDEDEDEEESTSDGSETWGGEISGS